MPYRSQAQKRLFQAAAHNPAFASKVGISVPTAKTFDLDSKGQDTSALPERVTKKCEGGSVSSYPSRAMKW